VADEIVVSEYDPQWVLHFETLCTRIWPVVESVAARIDHVGSTSVPGLAAKPIIDMDIVVRSTSDVGTVISLLEGAGYAWVGDLGVAEREAFNPPAAAALPAHHLYLVVEDSRPHLDHVLLRDLLRGDPIACERYAALKRDNARRAGTDIDHYVALKAGLVEELLTRARAEHGLAPVTYWRPDLPA
jgi:GrpB-like predicted nucleotidyltransferase (UPF0157 family)